MFGVSFYVPRFGEMGVYTHPRSDGESAQEAENTEDRDALLRKKVRKNIKRKEIGRGIV